MVELLEYIHKKQLESFISIEEFKQHKTLTKHNRGLYWIWTNLSFKELSRLPTKANSKEVPISILVEQRKDLKGLCKVAKDGFIIVYNGVGGYQTTNNNMPSFGLRERILQELNCSNQKTGTLNIINRSNENGYKKNWAVSYFDFNDTTNEIICEMITEKLGDYPQNAKALELLWRLEYGMPILSRY